jgi:hypothetical protein
MHEAANVLIRSYPNWVEEQTTDATFVYRDKDSVMTVFPDGSWSCVIPQKGRPTPQIRKGKLKDLDAFLAQFAADNP